ncbi:MAG: zinc ribbon domain-containing protein [Nitrospinota bacterium]
MPIYEYRCKKCLHIFEAIQGSEKKDSDLTCPYCSDKDIEKVMSGFCTVGGSSAADNSYSPPSSCGPSFSS